MVTSGVAGQREPPRLAFPPERSTSHVRYDGNESRNLVCEAQRDTSILSVRRRSTPKQVFWLNAPHFRSAPANSKNADQFAASGRKSGIRFPYRQVYQALIESAMSITPVFHQAVRWASLRIIGPGVRGPLGGPICHERFVNRIPKTEDGIWSLDYLAAKRISSNHTELRNIPLDR